MLLVTPAAAVSVCVASVLVLSGAVVVAVGVAAVVASVGVPAEVSVLVGAASDGLVWVGIPFAVAPVSLLEVEVEVALAAEVASVALGLFVAVLVSTELTGVGSVLAGAEPVVASVAGTAPPGGVVVAPTSVGVGVEASVGAAWRSACVPATAVSALVVFPVWLVAPVSVVPEVALVVVALTGVPAFVVPAIEPESYESALPVVLMP